MKFWPHINWPTVLTGPSDLVAENERVQAAIAADGVVRVEDPGGSHIEPPSQEWWDDLTKLQWRAAALERDDGVTVQVTRCNDDKHRCFAVRCGGFAGSPHTFGEVRDFINGASCGARYKKADA